MHVVELRQRTMMTQTVLVYIQVLLQLHLLLKQELIIKLLFQDIVHLLLQELYTYRFLVEHLMYMDVLILQRQTLILQQIRMMVLVLIHVSFQLQLMKIFLQEHYQQVLVFLISGLQPTHLEVDGYLVEILDMLQVLMVEQLVLMLGLIFLVLTLAQYLEQKMLMYLA